MGFSKALFGSHVGPTQSSFVKPAIRTLSHAIHLSAGVYVYRAFCLVLYVCKHCKVIRFSLIVAGFVFCKGEAVRRKNKEKNQVGFRKRKAGRWGKKKDVGAT